MGDAEDILVGPADRPKPRPALFGLAPHPVAGGKNGNGIVCGHGGTFSMGGIDDLGFEKEGPGWEVQPNSTPAMMEAAVVPANSPAMAVWAQRARRVSVNRPVG